MKEFLKTTHDVDLVVFDLDGTLVDSREDIAAAVAVAMQTVGGPVRDKQAIVPFIGRPLIDVFLGLLPASLAHRAEDAAQAYREYYLVHCADTTRLYPGVLECLNRLDGIAKAIATTKKTFMAVELMERLGLANRFVLVHGSDGIAHKPDPTVINQVLDKTGYVAEHSWMVGDTVYDIQAAKAAGMPVCAVTYGIGTRADLVAQNPDLLLDTLGDFLAD
ncbi:MAG: HAD-IA family hydrolase [Proteobacteria bacterium]|nr:HAD-IA family hydrolase [Pseudomonadota bacterium]